MTPIQKIIIFIQMNKKLLFIFLTLIIILNTVNTTQNFDFVKIYRNFNSDDIILNKC